MRARPGQRRSAVAYRPPPPRRRDPPAARPPGAVRRGLGSGRSSEPRTGRADARAGAGGGLRAAPGRRRCRRRHRARGREPPGPSARLAPPRARRTGLRAGAAPARAHHQPPPTARPRALRKAAHDGVLLSSAPSQATQWGAPSSPFLDLSPAEWGSSPALHYSKAQPGATLDLLGASRVPTASP